MEKRELALQRLRDVYIDRMGKAKSDLEAKAPKGTIVPRAALDAALTPLESQMKVETAEIQAVFDNSLSLLLEAFDKQLGQAAPSISQLPVAVTVVVESSSTRVPIVVKIVLNLLLISSGLIFPSFLCSDSSYGHDSRGASRDDEVAGGSGQSGRVPLGALSVFSSASSQRWTRAAERGDATGSPQDRARLAAALER